GRAPPPLTRTFPFFLAARHFGGERVELRLPEAAKSLHPFVHLFERRCVNGVESAWAFGAHIGKPALPQHLEMLRDGRLANPELRLNYIDDFAGRLLALGEQFENPAAYGIAEDVEGVHQL